MTKRELLDLLEPFDEDTTVMMCIDLNNIQLHDKLGEIADDGDTIILLNERFDDD
jgi:hypothetical protein